MRIKWLRLFSALLAILICFSAFPLGVFADSTEGDSWGGKTTGGSSSGNISSGQAFYNNTISGVRIYLSSAALVNVNRYKKTSSGGYTRSSAGDYVFFGKVNNGAVLDTYKRYAIYEISDNGGSGTSMISYLKDGSKTLKGLWKMNGSWYDNTAFYLDPGSVNSGSHSVNTNPDFAKLIKGMSNAKDSKGNYRSYKAWFSKSNGSNIFDFSSLSDWAHDIFANAKTEDLNKFLENYYNLLIDDFGIKASNLAEFPRTASDFISDGYCIVVEPVMISGKNDVTDAPYYAWSAQDFYRDLNLGSHFRGETSTGYFGKFAVAMKESFCIDYTSNKYNKNWSPSGKVSTKLGTSVPSGFPEANKAGGFAFYYSNDVIAQDVPVQVANTVVVDVGAPKYINGSGSATGGYLGDSGTLRVAVNSTAYLDTSGDPIKSDTSESAKKKGTAYSWYSGGSSFTKQTYSGGKTAVGNFAFNGTAIQSWLDDDSQKKFIKSGHTLSTVKNKNILLSSAVYSCIVNSGAGSISTSPSSVASDLKTQLGLLNLGYSATQLKTTREATTGGVSALGCGVAYTPEIYHSTSTVESTVHSKAKDWVLPLIGGLGGTYRKSYYAKNLEDKLSPAKTGGVTLSTGSLITGREKIAAEIKKSSTAALGYSGGLITTVTEGFSEGSIKKADGKNATAGLSVNVVASDVEVRHRYANVVIDKNGRVGYRKSEYGTVDSTVRDAAHLSFTFDRDARTAGGDYPNVYYLLFPNSETFIGSVFDFGSGTDPLSVSTIKKLANKVRWCDSAVLTESQKNDIMKSVFGKSVDNLDGISAPQFGVLGLPESGSLDIALGAAPYSTSGGASDFTGYTVICVTDYSRTAETLEGTAKLQPYEINYYYDTVLGENTEDELASVRVDNYDTSKIAAVKDSKNKSLKIGETSYYREVSEKNRSNAIDNSISLKMHDADSESNSTGMLKTVNALSTGASDSIKARKNLLIRDLLHVTSIGAFTIDDAFWNASENTAKVTTKNEQNMPKTIVPNYAVGLVRNVLCNEDARDVFSTLHPMNQAAAQAYSSGVYSPKAGSASVSEGVNISFLGNLGFSRFGFSTSVDNARSSGRWQNIGWVPYLWSESSKASAEASGHLSVELEDNFIWTAKRPLTVLLEAVDYVKNTENNITAVHQNAFSNNAQRAKYRLSEVVNSYVTAESDGVALPIDTSTQVLGAKTVSYSFKSNSDSSYRLVASRDSNRTGTLSFYPEVEMRAYLPVTVDNVQYANQDIRGTISGHGSVAPVSLFVLGKRCRNFVTSGINLVSAITGRSWNNTNLSMNGRLSAMTTSTGVSTSANAKALAETLKSKCGGTAPQMLTGGVDVSIGVDLVKNNSGSLSSAVQIKPVSYQVDYVGNNDKDAAVYADAKMYYSPATDSNLDKDPDWRGSARDKAYSSTNDIVASEMSDIAYFKQWLGTAFQNYSSASLAEKYFESVQNNLRSDISLNVYDSSGTFKNSYTGLSNKAGTAYSGNKTNSVATASFPIAIKDGRILGTLENDVTTAVETVNKGCSKTLGDTTEYQLKAALSYRALCLAVYLDINNLEVTDTNVAEHWGTAWEDETVKAYVNNMLKPILNSLETSKSSTNKSSKTNSAAYSGKEVQYAGTKNSEVADGTLRGFKPNSDKWYDEEVRVFTVMRYVPQGVSSSGTVGSQGLGSYLMSPLSASTKIPYDVVPEMGTGIEKEFSTAYLANWSVSVYFEGTVSGLKLSSDDTISSKDAAATAVRNKTAASKKSFLIPNLQIRNSYFGIGNSVTSDRIHN